MRPRGEKADCNLQSDLQFAILNTIEGSKKRLGSLCPQLV